MHPVGKYNELKPSSRWLIVSPCLLATLFLFPPPSSDSFSRSCSHSVLLCYSLITSFSNRFAHNLSLVLVSRPDSAYNFKFRINPTRSTEIYLHLSNGTAMIIGIENVFKREFLKDKSNFIAFDTLLRVIGIRVNTFLRFFCV